MTTKPAQIPLVSIGILTHKRPKAVERALESARDQDWPNLEIVLVDSASNDGTRELVQARFPEVKYIQLPRNLGCAAGRNHLFANCRGDLILCVDDDGYLGAGAVRTVVEAFATDDRIAVVAMRQCFTDEQGGRIEGENLSPYRDVGCFSGGVCALRREALESVGYYPDDFFLFGEESYLSLKLLDAGYRIVSEPRAIMWHPRIGSSSDNRHDYYRFRNPLLLATRLYPRPHVPKYLIGRLGSYFYLSIKRRSFGSFLRAAASALIALPTDLRNPDRVCAAALRRHRDLSAAR